MAFRFQRRIRLFPGANINLSKRGVGVSVGPRGAKLSVGRRGAHANVGLPGTGLSYRRKLDAQSRSGGGASTGNPTVRAGQIDGNLIEFVADGSPARLIDQQSGRVLSEEEREHLLAGNVRAVADIGEAQLQQRQAEQLATLQIHRQTPSLGDTNELLVFPSFDEPSPSEPSQHIGWFTRLIPPLKRRVQARIDNAMQEYRKQHDAWLASKSAHANQQHEWQQTCARAADGDVAAMEAVLDEVFSDLDFPYETNAAYSVHDGIVELDIDLPTREQLPVNELKLNKRDLILTEVPLSDRRQRMAYAGHVHSLCVFCIGTVFAALPAIKTVICSAFTQGMCPSTGNERDEFLLSVRITREQWTDINFERLPELNAIDVLEPFEQNKNMSKTGIFRPVEPLGEPGAG